MNGHIYGQSLNGLGFDIQTEYKCPNAYFYRYLQLHHAVAAQFGFQEVQLAHSELDNLLLEEDHSKLILRYYFALLTSSSPRMERVEAQWRTDIPSLTKESWAEVTESLLPSVISARQYYPV